MTSCHSGKFSTAPPPRTNVPVRLWLVNFLQSQPPCQHCLWEEIGVTSYNSRASAERWPTQSNDTKQKPGWDRQWSWSIYLSTASLGKYLHGIEYRHNRDKRRYHNLWNSPVKDLFHDNHCYHFLICLLLMSQFQADSRNPSNKLAYLKQHIHRNILVVFTCCLACLDSLKGRGEHHQRYGEH